MGWWGAGVLDGDAPMNFAADIAAMAGVEDGLLPLAKARKKDLARVREWVASPTFKTDCGKVARMLATDHTGQVFIQVLATIMMAAGAHLDEEFKQLAVEAARRDSFAGEGDADRVAEMQNLITAIEGYDGAGSPQISSGVNIQGQLGKYFTLEHSGGGER